MVIGLIIKNLYDSHFSHRQACSLYLTASELISEIALCVFQAESTLEFGDEIGSCLVCFSDFVLQRGESW